MAASEIEKLERRYAENPQGLTFAPLAEVHRKNGDVPRALELLRAGLELHPNYIPASIVLGRCHWDAGDLPAAEAAFAHVLRLDDENVIALKSLAEINERLARFGEAQRWLNRLLSVDRSNEEARQQLTRLEAAKQAEKQASPPATVPEPVEQEPAAKAASAPKTENVSSSADLAEIPAGISAPEPMKAQATPVPSAEPVLDLTAELAEPTPAAVPDDVSPQPEEPKSPALEFVDTSEPVRRNQSTAQPDEEPLAGLISAEFVPPQGSTYRMHPELTQDFVAEPKRPAPDAFENLEVEAVEEVELRSSGGGEFRVPNAADDFMDLAPPRSADASSAGEPIDSQFNLTPAAPSAPEPQLKKAPESPPVGPTRPSYSVRDTKGQSVASFFASLLASRPSGSPEPGQAAGSASGSRTSGALGEGTPTVGASEAAADVSFDEFFGAAAGESGQTSKAAGEAGKDDLDQFQTWLQNLKR